MPLLACHHNPTQEHLQLRRMLFPEGLQALSGGAWVALLVTAWVLWVSWRFNLHGSFQAYVYDKRYVIGCCCWGCRQQCW